MPASDPSTSSSSDLGIIRRSPRAPSLDGTHLNWLLDCYIESCRERLDHQITVDGYEYQLRWVKDWWHGVGRKKAWLLQPSDLIHFEKHLRSAASRRTRKPLSYHTRHTILKRLREALKWAHEQGYLDRSYTHWVPQAEGAPPKRKAAQISQLERLLAAVGAGPTPVRNQAIVALLMGMGLRRAEVSAMNIEDVVIYADYSGTAQVRGKRTKANPLGEREAAFDSATGKLLMLYLDDCTMRGRLSGPLFLGQRRGRLGGGAIYVMLKKAIAEAGLDGHIIGPHDLRRAFATIYRRTRKGQASADLLQRQLGHADINQTNEYTLLDVEDIRADIVSPMSLFGCGLRAAGCEPEKSSGSAPAARS